MSATHPLSLTACCNRKLHRHRAVPQFAAAKVQHFPEPAKHFTKKIATTLIPFKILLSRQKKMQNIPIQNKQTSGVSSTYFAGSPIFPANNIAPDLLSLMKTRNGWSTTKG